MGCVPSRAPKMSALKTLNATKYNPGIKRKNPSWEIQIFDVCGFLFVFNVQSIQIVWTEGFSPHQCSSSLATFSPALLRAVRNGSLSLQKRQNKKTTYKCGNILQPRFSLETTAVVHVFGAIKTCIDRFKEKFNFLVSFSFSLLA